MISMMKQTSKNRRCNCCLNQAKHLIDFLYKTDSGTSGHQIALCDDCLNELKAEIEYMEKFGYER